MSPTSPLGDRWYRGFLSSFAHLPPLLQSQGRGLPLPLSLPWTQHGVVNPSRSILSCIAIHFLNLHFFDLFCNPLFIHQPALLEPACPILVSNLASKTGSKSMLFGVQEPTYVATTENVKIGTTLKRKPCFCLPRPPKNSPKFNKKSILRASYVAVFF